MKQKLLILTPLVTLICLGLFAYVQASPTVERGLTDPKTGVVLDAATQKPIAGAFVLVRWTHHRSPRLPIGHAGRSIAGGGTHAVVVRTGADGRFEIPSPGDAFPVSWTPSLSVADDYRWDLSVYAPGYTPPKFAAEIDGHKSHPAVQTDAGNRQQLAPIAMAAAQAGDGTNRAYYLTTVVPRVFTCWGNCGPLDFADVLYREAYPLVCDSGGLEEARPLAELRSGKFGSLVLPSEIEQALAEITKPYRFNDPLPEQDARRICELLKQADEAHP